MSGRWGAPNLPSGLDQFTSKQQPDPRPLDDLSRFVMDRIRQAESEPRVDMIAKYYSRDMGPMAHRYAAKVREDCAAFRRILWLYVDAMTAAEAAEDDDEHDFQDDRALGLRQAVAAIAERWADRPEFKQEWRVPYGDGPAGG